MKKISSPAIIEFSGNKVKIIEEYIGRVNSATENVSIARMRSPSGWIEPGQQPEFDEYTVVLKGTLHIDSKNASMDVRAGEAVIVYAGEWIQYSSPGEEGAEYISVCLPAFSLETVNRDIKE